MPEEKGGEVSADRLDKRLEEAMEIRKKLGMYKEHGKTKNDIWRELSPVYADSIIEYCFGMIWNQPLLDLKTRELIVIVTGAAQNIPEVVEDHVRGALRQGMSREEAVEVIVQCAPYIGLPKTNQALKAAKRAFDRLDCECEEGGEGE